MKHSPGIDSTAGITFRKTPPGPRGHWLLGSMPDFLNDSLGYLRGMAQDYGDVVRYRVAHMIWYQVNQPAGIARILQENNRNYGKGALTLGILRPVAGNGLFLSEGEFWLRQRRLMQPTFHHRHVAAFGTMMVDATRGMLDRWEAHAAGDRPIDIMQAMSGLTLEIVSRALFSTPAGDDAGVGRRSQRWSRISAIALQCRSTHHRASLRRVTGVSARRCARSTQRSMALLRRGGAAKPAATTSWDC